MRSALFSLSLSHQKKKIWGEVKKSPNGWKRPIPGQEAAGLPRAERVGCATDPKHQQLHSPALVPAARSNPQPMSRRSRHVGLVQLFPDLALTQAQQRVL